ncbi:hypothetical protein BRADI_5g07357v3 [Brachypodium distachyon]|uniref:Uncharacterized protein n=1 Tax=Brachypodium distachyon TaxID=15368 RepID=A0A2K2CFT3_BRADI|nr:hypothetical protein BRADI_5g07357v3 [Brachypodium distachyon]
MMPVHTASIVQRPSSIDPWKYSEFNECSQIARSQIVCSCTWGVCIPEATCPYTHQYCCYFYFLRTPTSVHLVLF